MFLVSFAVLLVFFSRRGALLGAAARFLRAAAPQASFTGISVSRHSSPPLRRVELQGYLERCARPSVV
jgi:hypothetical protein